MAEERSNTSGSQHGRGDRRYYSRPKTCQFCADKSLSIDYKKADMLRRFVTDDGKIRPRRQTGGRDQTGTAHRAASIHGRTRGRGRTRMILRGSEGVGRLPSPLQG